MQRSVHVLVESRRMPAVCNGHARYAEKGKYSKSTHSVRDEWGVTAAAQADRARARAEGQCC